jgi:hypothetical protein
MYLSMFALLIAMVVLALASTPATAQMPSKRPDLSGTLSLLCTPQIAWCEGMAVSGET